MFLSLTDRIKEGIKDSLEKPNPFSALGRRAFNMYCILRESLDPSQRLARGIDREFDSKYGVQTKAYINKRKLGLNEEIIASATCYHAIRPTDFNEVVRCVKVKYEEFVFVDFGSGMGRALLLASELPFKKIIGVEYSQQLHFIAEENIRRYKSGTQKCFDIESIYADASQYPIPQEKAIFFFYNPFKDEIMTKVLNNIEKSLDMNPRQVFIIYVNPICIKVFERFSFDKIKLTKEYVVYRSLA